MLVSRPDVRNMCAGELLVERLKCIDNIRGMDDAVRGDAGFKTDAMRAAYASEWDRLIDVHHAEFNKRNAVARSIRVNA